MASWHATKERQAKGYGAGSGIVLAIAFRADANGQRGMANELMMMMMMADRPGLGARDLASERCARPAR